MPGKIVKYKEDSIWSFESPDGTTESGHASTKTTKCLGYKDDFLLLQETLVDIIATQKTFDKVKADHEKNSLIGVPYTLFIDSLSGKIDRVETEFKEYEELINSTIMGMGGSVKNYFYPYGKQAVDVQVGSSWDVPTDSVEFFMGDDANANYMRIERNYTFDKIKNKKGKNIAYVSGIINIFSNIIFIQDAKIFEGTINGIMKEKMRYDLNENLVILYKQSGALKWDFLLEGEHISAVMNLATKEKRVK